MSFVIFYYFVILRFHFPSFFFFNDTATTEIYTLSLHDALPICDGSRLHELPEAVKLLERAVVRAHRGRRERDATLWLDRKSTRLNSSHLVISYAVFCLKKKKQNDRSQLRSDARSFDRTPFFLVY